MFPPLHLCVELPLPSDPRGHRRPRLPSSPRGVAVAQLRDSTRAPGPRGETAVRPRDGASQAAAVPSAALGKGVLQVHLNSRSSGLLWSHASAVNLTVVRRNLSCLQRQGKCPSPAWHLPRLLRSDALQGPLPPRPLTASLLSSTAADPKDSFVGKGSTFF
ncbi:uncharacterized protein LOC123636035 isoform X2 [Lemur catta]|nr:uncharacterized protein LOC123636035 isoform X2 [Lemur catta]